DFEEDEIKSLFIRYQLYSKELKSSIDEHYGSGSYVKLYQKIGNLIRYHGKIENRNKTERNIENIYRLPEIINRIIKLLRHTHKKKNKATLIVIDAIRNPYEAKYFKDRYAAFYLVSINTNNDDRVKYLGATRKFTPDEVKTIDITESAKLINEHGETKEPNKNEKLYMQNVPACLEISDIHLYNPRVEPENNNALRAQLTWYLSLMKHPGLITPTSNERVMQFAFSAKVNSGCISRQVGAAVTDVNNSIRSIGWNDVAEGQTPCNLRSLDGLMSSYDPKEYSKYEREDNTFRNIAIKQLDALNNTKETNLNFSYCFKSFQNIKEKEKNQVHTRSLHAEENAFLQIAKSGGAGIKNGKLFTTASPCELCAKKAYQLGIKEIVYIDPYPGIAIDHIINIGETPPVTTQFIGAVGSAYHRLYEPLMPFKDQLELLKSD
ncbi:deoxycytidylate deaminase, partial [Enterovibrio norvegicus]|uniref:hypothetical protein n=1 Tax=Enterovibrio norvegicus TaxID=188144 RepID=UPI00036E6949